MTCAVSKAKAAPIDNFNAPQAAYSHPFMEAHKQEKEADVWAPPRWLTLQIKRSYWLLSAWMLYTYD